ncbi:MAG: tyrosinase family protein [Ginsengibacter sp.]
MEYLLTPHNIDRRIFIKGMGFISAGLLLGTLGGCEELAESIKNRPTRRRLRTGSAAVDADIATYKEAVRLMKKLSVDDPADPRGWDKQAAIHGTVAGGFNFCQHNTDHFFSWHRAYLFYFEKICQELTGNKKFGLPYWNWNQNPDINPAFLDVTSPLFLARTRNSVAGFSPTTTAALDPIFTDTNFFTFGPQIEGTPHNNVHGIIGATMGTGGSALDPVFWTHHCMVDYCWYKWNVDLGNNNTNDAGWLGTSWNHFFDANGNPANITAGITTIMPLLSYQYEGSTIGSHAAALVIKTKKDFQKIEKRIRAGAAIKFDIQQRLPVADTATISISKPFSIETKASAAELARIINNDMAKEKVFARIQYASLPPTSDFFVRVFINMQQASAGTSTEDPHFAGTFAFFGTEAPDNMPANGHHHEPRFLVDITNILQKLKRAGNLTDGDPISMQLVAVPFSGQFEKPETEIRLNKIELIVTPVIINAR